MGVRIQSVWGIRVRGIWRPIGGPDGITPAMSAVVAKAQRNDPTWKADATAIDVDLGCVLVAGLSVKESGAA